MESPAIRNAAANSLNSLHLQMHYYSYHSKNSWSFYKCEGCKTKIGSEMLPIFF